MQGIKLTEIARRYFPDRSIQSVFSAYQRAKRTGIVSDVEPVSTASRHKGELNIT